MKLTARAGRRLAAGVALARPARRRTRPGPCPLYVRAQLETAGLTWTQRDLTGPNEQPARPGNPSSRAIFAGGGRCWVRTNVTPISISRRT